MNRNKLHKNLLDFLYKSKIVEGFLGKTKPSRTAYSNVHEEERQVLTTKSPSRLTYAESLFTKASIMAIVTALSSYSTALATSDVRAPEGAALINNGKLTDIADLHNWQQIDQRGDLINNMNPAQPVDHTNALYIDAPSNKTAITYKGDHALVADVKDRVIPAINLGGNNPKAIVVQENITIGSISKGTVPIVINPGKILRFSGTSATEDKHGFKVGANIYDGVGKITVQGELIIDPMVNITDPESEKKIILRENIVSSRENPGILTILGACQIEQNIGSSNARFNSANFNTTEQVDLLQNVRAAHINIENLGILNIGGSLFTNKIDLLSNSVKLIIADGQKIVGNISSPEEAGNGEITFLGTGSIEKGVVRGLGKLIVGKGDVSLISGAHKIDEIQGNGSNTLSFNPGFTLEGSVNSTGGQPLNLTFRGGAINQINGIVGSTDNPVGDIQVQQGSNIFEDKVNANNIMIGNEATAIFVKSITAKNIKGLADNQGTVKFNNNSNIVVNSKIGDINPIQTIEVANEDVEVTEQVSVGKILFSSDKESTLTLLKAATITEGVATTGNNLHTLVLAEDFDTLTVPFGSNTNKLKTVQLQNDNLITINSNNFHSNLSTAADNTGKVLFKADGNSSYELGSSNLKLSEVIFEGNSEVQGDVYAHTIRVAPGKNVTFAGTKPRSKDIAASIVDDIALPRATQSLNFNTVIDAPNGLNLAADSTINFTTSTLVKSPINNGRINCTGDTWFQKEVNNAAHLNFAPGKLTVLEGNISATNITANNSHIIIMNPITAAGGLHAQNLTLDLGNNQLRYAGDAVLAGELKINIFYDTSTLTGGHIKMQDTATMDLTGVEKMLIKITARSDINNLPQDTRHNLIVSDGDVPTVDEDKITLDINEENHFVKWVIEPGTLTLRAQDISNPVLLRTARSAVPQQQQFIAQLVNADPNSEAGQYKNSLGFIIKDQNAANESMVKLHNSEVPNGQETLPHHSAEMTEDGILQTSNHTTLRMATSQKRTIGAGEEESSQYGIWGSPLYGYATQKMKEGASGYKLKSMGGVFGIDTFINDNLLIGAAYSRLNTKMSYKNQKVGDKTKGQVNIFSLYSSYNFPSNWLIEGIFSYGKTQVKNFEGRLMGVGANRAIRETAIGKYKTTYCGGKLLTGYNYRASDKLVLTPLLGLRYSHFADSRHQETGTSFQNIIYQKRTYHKLESLVGLRALTSVVLNDIALIPEFHGYFNYAFKRKSPVVEARLGGLDRPLDSKIINPNRRYYNVGTSLTAKYRMMEYGVAYNADLGKKYIAHQGSLKLRVNL
ncbi:autotransporter outer membrane beta-barrel domain-containing protein [Candidatus Tisiphia endosymbiont of Beris chalybata]|uniref:autotransporter family protein n=1 Tax=Candidatus Tisiphia endosymbiont of Beris chalybata TaxID=3066262 RepID=UPI00312C8C9E